MSNEPRKASDVLLSVEAKLDQLIAIYRGQDLVLKVLSNKLNSVIEVVENLKTAKNISMTTEKINIDNDLAQPNLLHDFPITMENNPTGFRRTSRPETYDGEQQIKQKPTKQVVPGPKKQAAQPTQDVQQEKPIILPVQFPNYEPEVKKLPGLESLKKKEVKKQTQQVAQDQERQPSVPGAKIPIEQRIVDENGKAIFLANIEIFNENNDLEYKTRTNGTGKWQASLGIGKYNVKITKQASVSKDKIDINQPISVDGLSITQVLPVMICK